MPLHITVIPASTKAGRETIRQLLASESRPIVHGIYRDPSKAPSDFTQYANFKATKGDVGTGDGLDFRSSNAVFYIPPPTYDGTDQGEWATLTATNVKNALQNAPSIKKLVLFSSVGAQHDHGTGIIRLNHISDTILENAAPEVVVVRPGYFQEDWAAAIEAAVQSDPPVFHSWITPADHKVPIVSLQDIARTCANCLLEKSTKPKTYYIKLFGPRHYSSIDLKNAVEQAAGKKVELKLVEKDQLGAFFAQQIPEAHVAEIVDLATSALPGGMLTGDFEYDESTVRGEVELASTFSKLYARVAGKK
ncbi:hypothetical protein VTI74DRAFT_7313 [Chaetomium olivicolor]